MGCRAPPTLWLGHVPGRSVCTSKIQCITIRDGLCTDSDAPYNTRKLWSSLFFLDNLELHEGYSNLLHYFLSFVRDDRSDLRSSPAFFLSFFLYQLLIWLVDMFDHFKIRICFAIVISTAIRLTSYLLGHQCRRLHVFLAIQHVLINPARMSEELWTDHYCYCKNTLFAIESASSTKLWLVCRLLRSLIP